MLPKKKKVERPLFPLLIKKGKTYSSSSMSLRAVLLPDFLSESKFSFVVSKKVAPRAHERNLLKRRGFAVVKKALPHIVDSALCVFYMKKPATELSFSEFEKEVKTLLQKAGVLAQ